MNIRDLRYLKALAKEKHFGRAAEFCNVSQPTLSVQIKKMEDDLGIPLLERSGRTVILTCLLYTSPSPRDLSTSRMPSSA